MRLAASIEKGGKRQTLPDFLSERLGLPKRVTDIYWWSIEGGASSKVVDLLPDKAGFVFAYIPTENESMLWWRADAAGRLLITLYGPDRYTQKLRPVANDRYLKRFVEVRDAFYLEMRRMPQ